MLFKRKHRKPFWAYVRDFIWPSMGWKRTYDYIKHRILRLPASNHSIAFGLASGCIVSWTPLFGFHIIQCFVLCLLGRGNFLAGLLGTTFGNPWTFPILLWSSYKVGDIALGLFGYDRGADVVVDASMMSDVSETSVDLFLPMLVGGYILMAITLPLFYMLFFYMIRVGRSAQKQLVQRKSSKNNKAKKK